jgi:PIN like domain
MASKKSKSKRQSAGKPEQLRLDDFILHLDENLDNCQPIIEALVATGVQYRRHRDFFPRGTLDEDWLPFVAERAWIVLTKDKRNRYNEIERDAVRRHRVREFYFGSGNFNGTEMAQALCAAIPQMKDLSRTYNAPLVGSIARSGHVTIVYDEHGSTHERRKAGRRRK